MDQKHTPNWGWMLYADFFLSALGGGLLVLASLTSLFYGPQYVNVATFLAPIVAMGLGSSLLLLELGHPFRGWRVFTNPKSFLTLGALIMTISIALSLLLASFYISNVPWSQSTGLRNLLSVLATLTGFGVAFYPGLLLGRMPGRPFWNGPLLAPLFLLSGLSTGVALFCLIEKIWPTGAQFAFCSFNILNTLFMAAQLIGWSTYVYLKRSFASPKEVTALRDAFAGGRGLLFWGGFMGLGLVLPGALYLTCGAQAAMVAHLLVLIGALMMRGFVVTADHSVSLEFSR